VCVCVCVCVCHMAVHALLNVVNKGARDRRHMQRERYARFSISNGGSSPIVSVALLDLTGVSDQHR